MSGATECKGESPSNVIDERTEFDKDFKPVLRKRIDKLTPGQTQGWEALTQAKTKRCGTKLIGQDLYC